MTTKLSWDLKSLVRVAAVALVMVALIAGVQWFGRAAPPAGLTLTDLTSVEQLQARFNADQGTPRLILVLSPT